MLDKKKREGNQLHKFFNLIRAEDSKFSKRTN
jgi:hypothetical protein